MARTKTRAYKNQTSPLPSSYSSPPVLSPSPVRSPSPPPKPTPPHSPSDNTFSDYLSSSPELYPQPLSTQFPPLYQCPTPSVSQCPPHLRTTMNPSSSTTSSQRRSMRILADIGTSHKNQEDNTIYIISDDEPSSPPTHPNLQTAPTPLSPPLSKSPEISNPNSSSQKTSSKQPSPKTTSQKSKPKPKSPSTLSQFLASKKLKIKTKSQKKPHQERSSPLISSKLQPVFSEKWVQRPIAIGRVFDFAKLQLEGLSIQHHTDALGWTNFLKISDYHYPKVIRAFYCKVEAFEDKSLIVSNLKGIEIKLDPLILADILKLPSDGVTIYGKDWYQALNISKDEVFQELLIDGSTRYLSADLKPLPKFFNNISQHNIFPHCGSHEFVSDNDALVIYHLLHCKRLNLPYLIIQHMIASSR
uniref:Flocculation protein FLO11-like n=1 Tax=Cicer arietinum TaxID=3827 RepID=A0A1S2YEH0_CICAR|nr:flocculation protein FLO11-like [Cicer arietinum]